MAEGRWKVPLSDVEGDDELAHAAATAVRSGWWSSGPRVTELEKEIAAFVDTPNALAVANGTAALHLGLLAAGVRPGDEVITPALTFVAAANAIRQTGAAPVFCDIVGDGNLNLDPLDLEQAVTTRTKAILPLHYGGYSCDMDAVMALAEEHGLVVVEDAAHAIGARHRRGSCGSIGDVGCFSFFSNKNLPIGEGGAVVTRDDELADRLRLLRSHGMTTMTWDRHRGHASSYDVLAVGFNYRLDEIRAAMGLVQLRRLPDAIAARARAAARYGELLADLEGLQVAFAKHVDPGDSAHHLVVVILEEGVDRERIRRTLGDQRVQTSVHYPPIHAFSVYADARSRSLPQTEAVAGRILTLPLFPSITDAQLELVVEALAAALEAERSRAARDQVGIDPRARR